MLSWRWDQSAKLQSQSLLEILINLVRRCRNEASTEELLSWPIPNQELKYCRLNLDLNGHGSTPSKVLISLGKYLIHI